MPQTSPLLLTGASGFLGRPLVRRFLAAGQPLHILTRQNALLPEWESPLVKVFRGSFNDAKDAAQATKGTAGVVHLAWSSVPRTATAAPIQDVETNIVGTLRLLEAARDAGCRRFAFVSSGGTVYGVPQFNPISESHETVPISAYGISKLAAEKYTQLFERLYDLEALILRVANAYGPGQNFKKGQGVIGLWMNHIAKNEALTVWGDGSAVRDYVFVDDLAEAIFHAWQLPQAGIFNLGTGQGVSLNTLIAALREVTGQEVPVEYLPARGFDVPVNVLDITRFKKATGWQPQTSLQEGLAKAWKSF